MLSILKPPASESIVSSQGLLIMHAIVFHVWFTKALTEQWPLIAGLMSVVMSLSLQLVELPDVVRFDAIYEGVHVQYTIEHI